MTTLIETTPKMDLVMQDIAPLVEALRASHTIYSPLLQRREQREAAHTSLQGLLATLPRKSIEPMVLAVEGVAPKAVRAMQSFISEGQGNDARLLHQHWKEVEVDLGAADGVLMVDGSAFPKQGSHAVGVTRQYWGELGKRANGQAGVFVGSVSSQGDTVLDRRVYVPTAWRTDDAYAARRTPCGLPPDLPCKPTPALAQERRAAVVQSQALRCRWVVADEAFGDHPSFLEGVAGLPAEAWTRQTITEGSQGPRVAECATLRVVAVREALPGPDVWLVRRRHIETGEWKTSRCNAPVDTAVETPGRMSGLRWPIDTCCEDSTQLLGMGDDEVRSWTGWHHHMTLVILAHFFVVRMSVRFKKKPPQ